MEKLSIYLDGKKDKDNPNKAKAEVYFQTKSDVDGMVKDEEDGYCSEQTADLTSDDSDLEDKT